MLKTSISNAVNVNQPSRVMYQVFGVLALSMMSQFAYASAAKVQFVTGQVTAVNQSGQARALGKGAEIEAGDTINTTNGRLQLRFSDGGIISLQPNTQFKVEDYNFTGKADGSERGFFRLVEGGLRAITGAIGHTNRASYKMNTPVATIGIRGTEFLAMYRPSGQKLYVSTIDGALYVMNEQGNLVVYRGQNAEVTVNSAPQRTDNEAGVQAQGPDNLATAQSQQNKENEEITVFKVNEQYASNGDSIAIPSIASPLTALAAYAAANAVGTYNFVSGTGSSNSLDQSYSNVAISSGSLTFNFGSGQIDANINVTATDNFNNQARKASALSTSDTTVVFSGTNVGTLAAGVATFNASISQGNSASFSSSSICNDGCFMKLNGEFIGSDARNIESNYTITNGSQNFSNGTANFYATNKPAPMSVR